MDTVSERPFVFEVTRGGATMPQRAPGAFCGSEEEAWRSEAAWFCVQENEEISLLFRSSEATARLYLEALDVVPPEEKTILRDAAGRLCCAPDEAPFYLYRYGETYDALCMGAFLITVQCGAGRYYAVLRVEPKAVSLAEWRAMRDDLEREVVGLSRQAGTGAFWGKRAATGERPTPPRDVLRDVWIVKKYARQLLPALLQIAEHPQAELRDHRLQYDIQANRVLKQLLLDYEKRLRRASQFLADAAESGALGGGVTAGEQGKDAPTAGTQGAGTSAAEAAGDTGAAERLGADVEKLRHLTAVIRTAPWFAEVQSPRDLRPSAAFFMDERYRLLYRLFRELRDRPETEPQVVAWKQSSKLYEMWCFVKLCRLLEERFDLVPDDKEQLYSRENGFPVLRAGAGLSFEGERLRLQLVYDGQLKYSAAGAGENQPLYMAYAERGRHSQPDIQLHIWDRPRGWYLGSVILECKYRKIRSFWGNTQWSSVEQFQTYYERARSKCQYGELGRLLQTRPVREVLVLTPDPFGEHYRRSGFHIRVCPLKPDPGDVWLQKVGDCLQKEMDRCVQAADLLARCEAQT